MSAKNVLRHFEKIDTQQKAYWLGFLYADGSVSLKEDKIELGLAEKDYKQLEKFKNFLGITNNICYRPKTKSYRLSFRSQSCKRDLINKGCIPKKSLILQYPTFDQVPFYLMKHFIRGYFDGDGTYILNQDNHNKEISCVCYCKTFLEWIQKDFEKNKIKSSLLKQKNRDLFCLRIYDMNSILEYYYIYWENASRFLDRKKEKMEEIYKYI